MQLLIWGLVATIVLMAAAALLAPNPSRWCNVIDGLAVTAVLFTLGSAILLFFAAIPA